MENFWCNGIELDRSPITETKYCVHLACSMNMYKDMKEELIRRRRAAWSAYGSLEEATDQLVTSALICSRYLLKFTHQHRAGLHSSDQKQMSRLRDPAEYPTKAKDRRTAHEQKGRKVGTKSN
ncbi:hypothetical protein Q1695_012636 [Nippostrongylus brasiliensis]|nr:hypothetical protein Q1695_012636 [Nippostrongylus brasiliensis]